MKYIDKYIDIYTIYQHNMLHRNLTAQIGKFDFLL